MRGVSTCVCMVSSTVVVMNRCVHLCVHGQYMDNKTHVVEGVTMEYPNNVHHGSPLYIQRVLCLEVINKY